MLPVIKTLFFAERMETGVFGIGFLDVDGGQEYTGRTDMYGIQRANLDGSNIKTLVTNCGVVTLGIALDVAEGRMYWTDADRFAPGTGNVQRANLDGSNIETLVSGLETPFGIALEAV